MQPLFLVETLPNGTQHTHLLSKISVFTAQAHAMYTVVGTNGKAPAGLTLKHHDSILKVLLNDEIVAQINHMSHDEFLTQFSTDDVVTLPDDVLISSSNAEVDTVVGASSGDDFPHIPLSDFTAGLAVWGGLAAGGLVYASASNSNDNNSGVTPDITAPAAPDITIETGGGGATNNPTISITLSDGAVSWEYSLDGGTTWNPGTGTSFALDPDTTYSTYLIQVRQTDKAGNVSDPAFNTTPISTDATVDAPTFTLESDTGRSSRDGVTNDTTVNVALSADVVSWEYSTNGGSSYSTGTGTSFELAANSTYAIADIQVRQTDISGNTSLSTINATAITTDTTLTAPTFSLYSDSGSLSTDGITNDSTVKVSLASDIANWEYSTNGGSSFITGTGVSFELAANTSYAAGDIKVRQTDIAGNISSVTSNTAAVTTDTISSKATFALHSDNGSLNNDGLTNDATVDVTLSADVASWEYSTNGGSSYTTGTGTSFELASNTIYAIGSIKVRQTDAAGNTGLTTGNTTAFITDTSISTPTLTLNADNGSLNNDGITNDATVNVTLVSDLASWEYSLDGGSNFSAGTGLSFELAANASYAIGDIQVRQTDIAGNISLTTNNTNTITIDSNAPTTTVNNIHISSDTGTLATDFVTNTAEQTITATLSTALVAGEILYGSVDNGGSWIDITDKVTDTAISWDGATLSGSNSIVIKVSDISGNNGSSASEEYILDTTAPTPIYISATYHAYSDTIVISGDNIETILTGSRVESPNLVLEENFDWSKLQWDVDGDNINNITFTEADIVQLSQDDNLNLSIWLDFDKADEIEGAAGFDPLVLNDQIEISTGFSIDLAGNISTTDSLTTAYNHDNIVVFDLVTGTSSDHSSRTFNSNTSYTIFIMVDSASSLLVDAPWWAGGSNLSSDDIIVLVGSGSPLLGKANDTIYYADSNNFHWFSGWTVAKYNPTDTKCQFTRFYNNDTSALTLWSGVNIFDFDNLQLMFITALPPGIYTSQGL